MLKHSTTILLFFFGVAFVSCDNQRNYIIGGESSGSLNSFYQSRAGNTCTLAETNSEIVDAFVSNYLFYDEIDIPADYQALNTYDLVSKLRVEERESFSFWIEDAQAYFDDFNQGINSEEFGFSPIYLWSEVDLASQDRLAVYVVDINSPAYEAGLRRGDTILAVDGVTSEEIFTQLRNMDKAQANAYHFELFGNDEITIDWQTPFEVELFSETIYPGNYNTDVIEHVEVFEEQNTTVGYLGYRSFAQYSEQGLIDTFDYFDESNTDKLIFDFRTNGGGSVGLANLIVNSTLNKNNELTGQALLTYLLSDKLERYNDVGRFVDDDLDIGAQDVVVIIDKFSCSASELVINSLLPYTNVTIIGDQNSCGKPYGMIPLEICGGLLSPVTLTFANANNEANYVDGFAPDCIVDNTNEHDWGDVNDPLIDEALHILNGGNCRTQALSELAQKSAIKPRLQPVSTYNDYLNPKAPIFKYQ